MDNIIEINGLSKSYGDILAVDNIDFSVERGSLFAFLGLNGAGKSTTINILCTLLPKDSGKVIIDGNDLDKNTNSIKNEIGIVFQNSVLDEAILVRDNLTTRASYYGLRGKVLNERLDELIETLELNDILKRPYGRLSGGQRRRVDIARALINRPKILFLDEPTTGLDPQTRQSVWKTINNLQIENQMTIFLTTHYMEEANNAKRVVILDAGKIVANDTPTNLKNKFSGDYIKLYNFDKELTEKILKTQKLNYRFENDACLIKIQDSLQAKDFIIKNPQLINDFEVFKGDMDDVFLNATGKKLGGTK